MGIYVKRLLAFVLVLMLLATPALAELSVGSSGEDVSQLQQKLSIFGFLEGKPDGVFGENTKSAVQAFQRYLNVEETGVVDDVLLGELELLWQLVIGYGEEAENADAQSTPAPEEQIPAFCMLVAEETLHTEYCWRHAAVREIAAHLSAENLPDRLHRLLATRICALWIGAIEEMYDELSKSIAMQKKTDTFEDRRREFRETLAIKRKAWQEEYGKSAVEAALAEAAWLEETGIDLCYEAYGPKLKPKPVPEHVHVHEHEPEATAQPAINP